jgi:glycosyltransferase involved in cell wall biosynthesis
MKILFVSAEPLRSRQAIATHVAEIVSGLKRAGHEVTICVSRVMGPYDRTSLHRRCAGYVLFWIQVLRMMGAADVVYARAHPANFPISLAARLRRIPVVQEINGTYRDIAITHSWLSSLIWLIGPLYRIQFRWASALIAVTPGLADWVRHEAPTVPSYVVANGVNYGIFNPSHPPLHVTPRNYAFFFGSLTRWHGIETMIAAIDNDEWPADVDLIIVGDGQLSAMVREAAGRNPRIQALPSVNQETLAGYIRGAAMGLVPINSVGDRSRFGVSPLKLYETLACGTPVVVTEFAEQAELVRSFGAGIVIPPNDPGALARAVCMLNERPISTDKMLQTAATIGANHSWTNRSAETERILLSVAARDPK